MSNSGLRAVPFPLSIDIMDIVRRGLISEWVKKNEAYRPICTVFGKLRLLPSKLIQAGILKIKTPVDRVRG